MTRRALLRGAGVALSLPWLESLAPRSARGQAGARTKRFLPIFFPNGTALRWRPAQVGSGADWSLSPILQPFAPVKQQMTVLTNVENYSPFNAEASPAVEPAEARLGGAFMTCVDSGEVADTYPGVDGANGVSADQVIARALAAPTALESLQVKLSTFDSYCDGKPCSWSRCISWRTETEPLFGERDPQRLWDLIFGRDPNAPGSFARDRSALDAVLASASGLESKLDAADRHRLDEFLTSARDIEQRMQAGLGCTTPGRPGLSIALDASYPENVPGVYDRGEHADLMNDLIALALQCDVTRVISHMLDDQRSEFVYDHVPLRTFDETSSAPAADGGVCGNFVGTTRSGYLNDGYCTLIWWMASKVSELCQKLAGMSEGEYSVLDNTVVLFASGMRGGDHNANDLPVALLGGKGVLAQDQHVMFPDLPGDRPLRDVYFTIMNSWFELGVESFGSSASGAKIALIEEMLA